MSGGLVRFHKILPRALILVVQWLARSRQRHRQADTPLDHAISRKFSLKKAA
jgi:hypothetical protein